MKLYKITDHDTGNIYYTTTKNLANTVILLNNITSYTLETLDVDKDIDEFAQVISYNQFLNNDIVVFVVGERIYRDATLFTQTLSDLIETQLSKSLDNYETYEIYNIGKADIDEKLYLITFIGRISQ